MKNFLLHANNFIYYFFVQKGETFSKAWHVHLIPIRFQSFFRLSLCVWEGTWSAVPIDTVMFSLSVVWCREVKQPSLLIFVALFSPKYRVTHVGFLFFSVRQKFPFWILSSWLCSVYTSCLRENHRVKLKPTRKSEWILQHLVHTNRRALWAKDIKSATIRSLPHADQNSFSRQKARLVETLVIFV